MKKIILFCFQLFLIAFSEKIISQTIPTSSSTIVSPEGVFDIVFDRFGNQYSLANLNVHSSKPVGGPQNVTTLPTSSCNAGYFTLWFVQNSICDLNANAKNRMCELFSNLSGLLPSPLTTNSLQVNILCADYTGTLSAAAIATGFHVFPINPSNPFPGVIENQAQKAIITGSDPYLNIPVSFFNATTFFHGAVYTSTNVSWDYTSTTTTINPSTADFYSIHLHEALHILGIGSLIDYNGYSQFGQANNYFGIYDKFLVDNNGTHLITSSTPTSCPNTNVAFTTSLVSVIASATTGCVTDVSNCSTAIQYSSAVTQMTVYTPNCWEDGSSLSHFEDNICPISGTVDATCYAANGNSKNNLYYVMANGAAAGDCFVKRYLKEEERKVLCDLGYTVNATYTSNIAVDGTLTSHSYSSSACSPTAIILGINDGLVNGAYIYTTTTTSAVISYSTLLTNDLPATGLTVTCLELVYVNNATLTPGSTNFTVNSYQSSGLVLLKYYPKNSSGQIGNVTYVYVYFIPVSCNPSGLCNIVNNGGFETSLNCGFLASNIFNPRADCWVPIQGSTYLYSANCSSVSNAFNLGNNTLGTPPGSPLNSYSGAGNNVVLGLGWPYSYTASPGAIKNNLSSPIIPTHTYQLTFFANNYYNTYSALNNTNPVVISIATSSVYAFTPSQPFPTALDVIAEFTINAGTNWSQLTHTFVFTPSVSTNHYALIVGINYFKTLSVPGTTFNPSSNMGYSPDKGIFCFIDDISLVEFPVPTFSIPNPTICGNQSFTNLAQYASTTGTFSGQGVTSSVSQQHFNLNNVISPGIYPIAFTYSSITNTCLNTIYQLVTVGSNTNFVALNLNPINLCLSNATLDLNSLLTNTNLVSTTFSIAGLLIHSPYTFSAAGQYTLSASNTSTSLCSNSIYTTLVNVYSSSPPWFTEGGFTVSSATICSGNTYSATANSPNSSFVWQPGNLTGFYQTLNPTVTTIYTVSSFDYSLCASTSTFAVIIATNCCNGSSLTPFTGTATASSTVFTGSLLISNDITIPSSQIVSFQNCDVQFLNNAKITIQGSSELSIVSSHLHSCDNSLWFGIILNDGAALTSTAGSGASSLIEDAVTAIDVSNYTNTAVSTILDIHNTIFNKNYISINISNYTVIPSPYTPFEIDNCVFTCREIPFTSNTWPTVGAASSTTGIAAQLRTAINTPTGLAPPYLAQSGFSITTLKSPYSSQPSQIAIQISSVGITSGTIMYAPTIGSTVNATDFNLFDAHGNFIVSKQSNLSLYNNVFQNTQTYSISSGTNTITYGGSAVTQSVSNALNTALLLNASSKDLGNRFWDCHKAIEGKNMFRFWMQNSTIRSTQSAASNATLASPAMPGNSGIDIATNRFQYYIVDNEFTNIKNATKIGIAAGSYTPFCSTCSGYGIYAHSLRIVYNAYSSSTVTNSFMDQAILIQGQNTSSWASPTSNSVPFSLGISIDNNTLTAVHRGIYLNGNGAGFPSKMESNIITLKDDNSNSQHGVVVDHTYGKCYIVTNKLSALSTTNTSQSLFYFSINSGLISPSVTCNTATNCNKGFEFNSTNGTTTASLCTYWRGNQMENLSKGLILTGGGMIGPQGNSGWPIDNQWLGSWSGNNGVYADNSNALNSKLTVKTGTPWAVPSPTGNVGLIQSYGAPSTIFTTTLGDYYCGSYSANRTAPTHTFASTVSYYISNTSLFRFLHFNDSLKNTNSNLIDFYDAKKDSSYGLFMQVEDKLYNGEISDARSLNNSFSLTGANTVEANYKSYYSLYANFAENDFNPTNSTDETALLNLANSCPANNGASVFQARALYSFVFRSAYIYSGNCDGGGGSRTRKTDPIEKENLVNNNWNVELFPNPVTDQITFKSITESEELHITITDLSNRIVLSDSFKTNNFIANLEISLLSGLYLITINNDANNCITKKLIISK